jgi:hypothetical protein
VEFIRRVRYQTLNLPLEEQVLFPKSHTEDDLVAIAVSVGHLIGYGGSFVDYKEFTLEEVGELNRGSERGCCQRCAKAKS